MQYSQHARGIKPRGIMVGTWGDVLQIKSWLFGGAKLTSLFDGCFTDNHNENMKEAYLKSLSCHYAPVLWLCPRPYPQSTVQPFPEPQPPYRDSCWRRSSTPVLLAGCSGRDCLSQSSVDLWEGFSDQPAAGTTRRFPTPHPGPTTVAIRKKPYC